MFSRNHGDILVVLIATNFFCMGYCYSTGAPHRMCIPMFPKHGPTERQTTRSPFVVTLSQTTYRPGDSITVELSSTDGRTFRGFLVKATRKVGDTENAVGTFLEGFQNKTKVFHCEGGYKNAATHTDPSDVQRVTLTWRAPDQSLGDLSFKATFVETFELFWIDVISPLKAEISFQLNSLSQLPLTTASENDLDLSTCGTSKGCFLYPRYCSGSECKAAATFRQDGDNFRFELMARNAAYVSIGFSNDTKMGDDETVTCTAKGQLLSVFHGCNIGLHTHRFVTDQLRELKVRKMDDHILCWFERPRTAVTRIVNQSNGEVITTIFDLHDKYHVMLAWGTVKEGTDAINKHTELPPVTDTMVDFRSFDIYRGSALQGQPRIHGSLMVISWVLLAGLTTAMSRYFKHWLAGHQFCGTLIWFQMHRAAGISVGIFTIIGIIYIFIYSGSFSTEEKSHAIVGLTVTSIVVVQAFAGIFRPDKESNFRPYFNWGHKLLGQGAHILSVVTIYLAFYIRYIPEVMREFGVAVVTGWVAVQIVWIIVFELRRCCPQKHVDKRRPSSLKEAIMSVESLLLLCYCVTLVLLGAATLCAIHVY